MGNSMSVGCSSVNTGFVLGSALIALLGPVPLRAQPVDAPAPSVSDGTPLAAVSITYTPADFARFAPRTALDMVERIPDFRVEETSGDRGLGQASENILVNGQRVVGKSNDARSTLGRISARAVERIELVDGATLGIPGLTGRVANVIVRSSTVEVQFRWDAQFRRNIEDQISVGSVSASGRLGETDFSLSLSNSEGLRRGGVGTEFTTNADDSPRFTIVERASFHADRPRLAGSIKREWDDGSILNANLAGELYLFTNRVTGVGLQASDGAIFDNIFRRTEDEWNVEGGLDYAFAVGDGRLKLVAFQSFEHSPIRSRFVTRDRPPGTFFEGFLLDQVADEGESVVRGEYSWPAGTGDWQVAIEGAYNFLEIAADFGALQADDSFSLSPLPGGATFVDEWRGEATVTRGWQLATGLTLQTTLGGEYSRIRQTSAGGLSRSFVRPKGSAALAWTATRRLTVNASIERRVGQLSFFDFSSVVDVQNNVTTGANVRLVPEQSWRAEVDATRSLGAAGSLTFGAYAEWITDIVDQIPLSATDEGVGNLPRARRWGITGRGTLLLDVIGWRGGRINANGTFGDSDVRDPLTGQQRRISEDDIRDWLIEFRHDIPGSDIAYGAFVGEDVNGAIFRLDQISRATLTRPVSSVFIEHKNIFGLTVRAGFRNILGTRDDLRRDVYVARRDGPIDFRERQLRRISLIGTLAVSGSF